MVSYITKEELKLIFDSGNSCQIIDVREPLEYSSVRIPNSKLVPLSAFDTEFKKIDFTIDVYFICGVGKRALKAAEFLETSGYKNLFVVEGGIKAWIEANYPVESS